MMRIRERMADARAEAIENILGAVIIGLIIAALGVVAYAFFDHINSDDLNNSGTSLQSSLTKRNNCPEFDKLVAEENARVNEKLGDAGVNHPQFSKYAQEHAESMASLYMAKPLIC